MLDIGRIKNRVTIKKIKIGERWGKLGQEYLASRLHATLSLKVALAHTIYSSFPTRTLFSSYFCTDSSLDILCSSSISSSSTTSSKLLSHRTVALLLGIGILVTLSSDDSLADFWLSDWSWGRTDVSITKTYPENKKSHQYFLNLCWHLQEIHTCFTFL